MRNQHLTNAILRISLLVAHCTQSYAIPLLLSSSNGNTPTTDPIKVETKVELPSNRSVEIFGAALSHEGGPDRFCRDYDDYFEPVMWEESGAGAAYGNWTAGIDKTSTEWLVRESEPNYFARQVLGWSDMDCGITYKGCRGMPTCDDVLTRVQDVRMARQIYFIILSMNNMNLFNGVISEQSLDAQVNVASMASNMAHTFFWKHDKKKAALCALEAKIVDALILAVLAAILVLAPEVVVAAAVGEEAAAAAAVGGAEAAAASGAEAAAVRAGAEGVAVSEGTVAAEEAAVAEEPAAIDGAAPVADGTSENTGESVSEADRRELDAAIQGSTKAGETTGKDLAGDKTPWAFSKGGGKKRSWNPWKKIKGKGLIAMFAAGLGAYPTNIGGASIESSVCSLYPNPPEEAEQYHKIQLDTNIRKAGMMFRSLLEDNMADINNGVGFGENGTFVDNDDTVMADQIANGDYAWLNPSEHLRFVEEPSLIERDMTAHFKNAAISSILKDNMCYMVCSPHNPEDGDANGKSISKSRFSPVPGTFCQTQCWRNFKDAKNLELFGLQELTAPNNDWDLDINGFIGASFKHWQKYRFGHTDLFPTTMELMQGTVSSSSGSFLPVCYSEVMDAHDFYRKGAKHNRQLPCVCGDRFGNETALFFHEAGFDNWVSSNDGADVAVRCQLDMEQAAVPPVEDFLALCNLGWHWPVFRDEAHNVTGDPFYVLAPGRDRHCDTVAAEKTAILEKGGTPNDVNCHVCWSSEIGIEIKKSQKSNTYGFYDYRFERACSRYASANACF